MTKEPPSQGCPLGRNTTPNAVSIYKMLRSCDPDKLGIRPVGFMAVNSANVFHYNRHDRENQPDIA